jgi:hypothetical protein
VKPISEHGRTQTFSAVADARKDFEILVGRDQHKFVLILNTSGQIAAHTTMLETGMLLHVHRWNYNIIPTRPKQLKARSPRAHYQRAETST